jgi:hypothetical protein
MNFFAHAYRFLDADPWFLAGTAVPDWLGMSDRRCRIRPGDAARFRDARSDASQLAAGIAQHQHDDKWFHQTATFAELHFACTRELAARLRGDAKFRPYFVAHILIEMLLDASLAESRTDGLDSYYRALASLDPDQIEFSVNRMAKRPTVQLAAMVRRFLGERFLFDYAHDEGIAYRINRILRAVGLPLLPPGSADWIAQVRPRVRIAQRALMLSSDEPPGNSKVPCHVSPQACAFSRGPGGPIAISTLSSERRSE